MTEPNPDSSTLIASFCLRNKKVLDVETLLYASHRKVSAVGPYTANKLCSFRATNTTTTCAECLTYMIGIPRLERQVSCEQPHDICLPRVGRCTQQASLLYLVGADYMGTEAFFFSIRGLYYCL